MIQTVSVLFNVIKLMNDKETNMDNIMEKYIEHMMESKSNASKQDAIKTRLMLDEYREAINYIDKNCRGNIKFARSSANTPELLALGMTAYCVRNTCLEDFHAQGVPIDDEKMKIFMKECSEKCAEVLSNLLSTDYMTKATMSYFLMEQCDEYCQNWDIPDVVNPSYLQQE